MYCLECCKEIGDKRICPYCGREQYAEPSPEAYRAAGELLARMNAPQKTQKKPKREKQPMFTDEERLALGLYPDDECYKMSLIAKICDRHRR